MSKRPSKRTAAAPLYEWRVVRLKKSPAALIGYVNAPDQKQAIAKAIDAFGITDPQRQARLSAYKVREVRP
jgi:1,2-phenylacetyl-CoA epoxidase PaaB subunit